MVILYAMLGAFIIGLAYWFWANDELDQDVKVAESVSLALLVSIPWGIVFISVVIVACAVYLKH